MSMHNDMTKQDPDTIREHVAGAYAEAIRGASQSCCSTGGCCSGGSGIAEKIGYSGDELRQVPEEVAASTFGCGNPLAFADVVSGQTVVDLGSGAGLDLLLASRAVGPEGRVIGIDMTDDMIETARRNVRSAGAANVEVRKGIIEAMPVADGEADWVISNCVINLSPEKERVFTEIARVLKPGGTMQVSDVVVDELPQWARERQDLFISCVGGAISEEEYLAGLRRAGLENVEVTERVVFTASQILAFLDSQELPVTAGDQEVIPVATEQIAESLAGKVWSAKIRAKKAATLPV